jgi:hypothetical protein
LPLCNWLATQRSCLTASAPQHSLINAAYQLICITGFGSPWGWLMARLPNGNVRRRTSSCRCVRRLGSLILCFKQAGHPPTTITCRQEQISGLLARQIAPSRPVGRQFSSSAPPHCCYFERLICLVCSVRTSCISRNRRNDRGYLTFVIACYAAAWSRRTVC